MVGYADPQGVEMQALANLVTTNETYMFREYDQLQAFANYCLPEVLSAKQARGERTLRIWSAGCSSGEEAYTLAMIVQEVFPQAQSWKCEIIATDIDENMLQRAQRRAMEIGPWPRCPKNTLKKYLIEDGEQWRVREKTAALVEFRHLNLQRSDGDASDAQLRLHFLPQRLDLLRRSIAQSGSRSLLQCPESGRLHFPGPLRIGGADFHGVQAEALR